MKDTKGQSIALQARKIEAIDVSSADYEADTDADGRPIPFTLLVASGGDLKVLPIDNSASVLIPVQDGYNPILLISVENWGLNTATGLWALYPYEAATVA